MHTVHRIQMYFSLACKEQFFPKFLQLWLKQKVVV